VAHSSAEAHPNRKKGNREKWRKHIAIHLPNLDLFGPHDQSTTTTQHLSHSFTALNSFPHHYHHQPSATPPSSHLACSRFPETLLPPPPPPFTHQLTMPERDTSYEDDPEYTIQLDEANKKKRKATTQPAKKTSKRRKCTRWTPEENERLRAAFEKYGGKQWKKIAEEVGNKNEDQCNQHWYRVLDPRISKKKWSDAEDQLLLNTVNKFGSSAWKKISNALPGRTDLQCRHRWTRLTKKQDPRKTSRRGKKKTSTDSDDDAHSTTDHSTTRHHSEECNSLDSPQLSAPGVNGSVQHHLHHQQQQQQQQQHNLVPSMGSILHHQHQHHPHQQLPSLPGLGLTHTYETPNSSASTYLDSNSTLGSAQRFMLHHQYHPQQQQQQQQQHSAHYGHHQNAFSHHYYPSHGSDMHQRAFTPPSDFPMESHHPSGAGRTLPMLQEAIGHHHFDTGHQYVQAGEPGSFHHTFNDVDEQFSFLRGHAQHELGPLSSIGAVKFNPPSSSHLNSGTTKTEGMLLNHDFSDLLASNPKHSQAHHDPQQQQQHHHQHGNHQ